MAGEKPPAVTLVVILTNLSGKSETRTRERIARFSTGLDQQQRDAAIATDIRRVHGDIGEQQQRVAFSGRGNNDQRREGLVIGAERGQRAGVGSTQDSTRRCNGEKLFASRLDVDWTPIGRDVGIH
jgi:hypothetical protein